MPVTCRNVDGTWRLVEADTGEVVSQEEAPVDGGGHESEDACMQQAKAVNAQQANRENNSPSNNPRSAKRLRNA